VLHYALAVDGEPEVAREAHGAAGDPFASADGERPRAGLRVVYTDGSCLGNPGPGGWAWAEPEGRYESGAEPHTTNQRMEIAAVLHALESLEGPVEIVSDSAYVVNCFAERWWASWRRRGWRNSKGERVANRDLWEPLIAIVVDSGREVRFRKVQGHAGNPMNEFVDRLATEAASSQQGVAGKRLASRGG
jgi:ribonuclease HI